MVNDNSIRQLKTFVSSISPVPDSEWEYARGKFREHSYSKKQLMLCAGDCVSNLLFILKGLVRYFYISGDGKEFNKAFVPENNFAGSISGLNTEIPSRFYIQALEETTVLAIPKDLVHRCYDRHPSWERLGRKLAERAAMQKEMREASFLLDSAETKYSRFIEEFRDIAERIPQYHMASYLGVAESSLSRIRKNIKD